jgi:histidinol-phosphate phosphatase family protein
MSMSDYEAVRLHLDALLQAEGAHVDATYVCPHDEGECDCRKPAPGLLLRAMRDIPTITAARSIMIGDSESDMEAGRRAGCRTIRVGSEVDPLADHTAPSLAAAVDWLADSGEIR